jgi:raffinose/stachyose/melibiose transport system permease protein
MVDSEVKVDESQITGGRNSNTPTPKVAMTMLTRKRQEMIFIVSLLFIPIAYWLFHWIYINGSTILMAFQDRRGNWSLSNFTEVYDMLFNPARNSTLGIGIKNSIKTFFASEFIGVPISLIVSYFLYKKILCYKTFRVIFYFPHIISGIVFVTVFKQFVSPLGPLTELCKNLNIALPEEGLLYSKDTATNAIIIYVLWTNACGNLLFQSAMSRVPPELIEVGKLEGLTWFKELVLVIMPLIWPTFSTTLVLDLCNILSSGGPVLLFGVADRSGTTTIPYWFFSKVYHGGVGGLGSYGVMSCVGLCFTAISVPFTLVIRHLLNKVSTAEF